MLQYLLEIESIGLSKVRIIKINWFRSINYKRGKYNQYDGILEVDLVGLQSYCIKFRRGNMSLVTLPWKWLEVMKGFC